MALFKSNDFLTKFLPCTFLVLGRNHFSVLLGQLPSNEMNESPPTKERLVFEQRINYTRTLSLSTYLSTDTKNSLEKSYFLFCSMRCLRRRHQCVEQHITSHPPFLVIEITSPITTRWPSLAGGRKTTSTLSPVWMVTGKAL